MNAINSQMLWPPFHQQADVTNINSSDSLLLNENLNINDLLIQQLLLNTNNNNTQQSNPSDNNSNNLWSFSFQQQQQQHQNFKK